MHTIDTFDGRFKEGNPLTGEKGTPITGAWLNDLQDTIITVETAQTSGFIGYNTRVDLFADLAHPDKSVALVTNDATLAYNGSYRKNGASGAGSWIQSSFDRISAAEAKIQLLTLQEADSQAEADAFRAAGYTWVFRRDLFVAQGGTTTAAPATTTAAPATNTISEDLTGATVGATSYTNQGITWSGGKTSGTSAVGTVAHSGTRGWLLSTDSSAWLSVTFTARTGILTFWSKTVAGGENVDPYVLIDGASTAATLISGTGAVGSFSQYSVPVTAGPRTVKWQLDSAGQDADLSNFVLPVP